MAKALDLTRAWWPRAAAAQVDPLQAVRETVAALEAGKPVPAASADHMVRALRTFLEGKGSDITANLGLRPRKGGRHEAPLELERRRRRDALIVELFEAQPGSLPAGRRAERVAALLVPNGSMRPVADEPREVSDADLVRARELLMREFGDELPTSGRQITRLVKAHKP